jgi:hypothetical protein
VPAAALTWYANTHLDACGPVDRPALTALVVAAVLAITSMVLPRDIHVVWKPWRDGPGALIAVFAIGLQAFGAVAVAFGSCGPT